MALRSIDRLLLIPALIVLGSLTVAGCSPSTPNNDSSSSSRDDRDDEADEEAEEEEDASGSGCPASFSSQGLGIEDFAIVDAGDFKYQAIGADILAKGCLFSIGASSDAEVQQGYLPGGDAEKAEIAASLEAAGYTSLSDGVYSNPEGSTVAVQDSADLFTGEAIDAFDLGFGDSFIVVTGLG